MKLLLANYLLFLVTLIQSCGQIPNNYTDPSATHTNTTQITDKPLKTTDSTIMHNNDDFIKSQWERLGVLLGKSKETFSETVLSVPPSEIGALDGKAFKVDNAGDMQFCVYVFENQKFHPDAYKQLDEKIPHENQYVLTSSNGALLFRGQVEDKGLPNKFRLGDVASAFSGVE